MIVDHVTIGASPNVAGLVALPRIRSVTGDPHAAAIEGLKAFSRILLRLAQTRLEASGELRLCVSSSDTPSRREP